MKLTILRICPFSSSWARSASSSSSTSAGFHVTIPVFYVNSAPHIGHLYSAVLADTFLRWRLLRDGKIPTSESGTKFPNDFIFTAGTDEHGKKIQAAAQAAGRTPEQHCAIYSDQFRQLFGRFGILNSAFTRTSSPAHIEAVQKFWRKLHDGGHIYKRQYEGWYSTVDECFYTDSQVTEAIQRDSTKGMVSIETQSAVSRISEENYAFDLRKFYGPILKWLTKKDVLMPAHFLPHLCTFMSDNTAGELSISRPTSRCDWGIPVPGDPTQTIYVWLDALVSYLSAVNYPNSSSSAEQWHWPPNVQILGKDILKFHAIYWPAFLLATGLPLPERLFVHGHWMVDKKKMSKSLGNVICPLEAANMLSVDGLRYTLLMQNPFEDGNFIMDEAISLVNANLVNDLANLLQRTINPKMNPKQVYPSGFDPKHFTKSHGNAARICANKLIDELEVLPGRVSEQYDNMKAHSALESLALAVQLANQFVHRMEPWKNPGDQEKNDSILFLAYEAVRLVAILMQPATPEFAQKLLTILGIPPTKRTLEAAKFNNISSHTTQPNETTGYCIQAQSAAGTIFPRIAVKQKA